MLDFSGESILIAEGNAELQKMFAETFSKTEFKVTLPNNGSELLFHLSDDLPHVLIIDTNLPDVSSVEVIEFARLQKKTSAKPMKVIVLVSKHLRDNTPEIDLADVVIYKPFNPQDMVRMTQQLLI